MLSRSVTSDSLWHHSLGPARDLCPRGFFREEYWSGLPCPPPGDLPNPGIETVSPALQADSLLAELPGKLSNQNASSHSHSLARGKQNIHPPSMKGLSFIPYSHMISLRFIRTGLILQMRNFTPAWLLAQQIILFSSSQTSSFLTAWYKPLSCS